MRLTLSGPLHTQPAAGRSPAARRPPPRPRSHACQPVASMLGGGIIRGNITEKYELGSWGVGPPPSRCPPAAPSGLPPARGPPTTGPAAPGPAGTGCVEVRRPSRLEHGCTLARGASIHRPTSLLGHALRCFGASQSHGGAEPWRFDHCKRRAAQRVADSKPPRRPGGARPRRSRPRFGPRGIVARRRHGGSPRPDPAPPDAGGPVCGGDSACAGAFRVPTRPRPPTRPRMPRRGAGRARIGSRP
jgi:hypothetical protein